MGALVSLGEQCWPAGSTREHTCQSLSASFAGKGLHAFLFHFLLHTQTKKMCFSFSHLHFASPQHQSASEAHLPSEPWEGKLRPGHHSSQGCLLGCLGLKYKTGTFLDSEAVFLPSRRLGKERAGAGQRAQLATKKLPCPCEAAWHSHSAPEEGDLFTMHPM